MKSIHRMAALALLPGAALFVACQETPSDPTNSAIDVVETDVPLFNKPLGGVHDHGNNSDDDLVEVGRVLFFEETFDGNGRTCATCHRAESNMTIDVAFITALHISDRFDPLFVAEFDDNLAALEDGGSEGLLRTRGLILENIQGFENPPVFRAPPSLFNLSFTAPYGLSGDFANLRDFSVGAVKQHFPKRLNREEGVDFRLPTEAELDALEAFMLSLLLPADGNFKVFGPNSILSTAADPRARDTDRSEVRGRDLLFSVGCTSCHKKSNKVFSGNTLNTGVEDLLDGTATGDTGDGSGRFQTPQLFLRKAGIFHNNAVGNTGNQLDNLRASVAFYDTPAFINSEFGTLVVFDADPNEKAQEIDDIARFLLAISAE